MLIYSSHPKCENFVKLTFILLLFFTAGLSSLISQPVFFDKLSKCQAPIPSVFTEALTSNPPPLVDSLLSKGIISSTQLNQFQNATQVYVDELLQAGQILFQDSFSQYINQIADRILIDQPDLRQKLQFFVIRSPLVNAFTSSDGLIFIHMGLFAHARNEAEIAFIICHEIIHYLKQHSLDIFIKTQASNEIKWGLKKQPKQDVFNQHLYSQQIEETADQLGLTLYLEAGYSPVAATAVFDLLAFNNQTFGKLPFVPTHLHPILSTIPKPDFSPNNPSSRPLSFGNIEQLLSHPDPQARKSLIRKSLARETKLFPENYFLVDKDSSRFTQLKEKAQFECCFYLLAQRQYVKAVYEALCLLQKHPRDVYLWEVIRHAVYSLACYKEGGAFWDIYPDYQDFNGPYQEALYFFEKLDRNQLWLLSLLLHQPNNTSSQHQARLDTAFRKIISTDFAKKIDPKVSTYPSLTDSLQGLINSKWLHDSLWISWKKTHSNQHIRPSKSLPNKLRLEPKSPGPLFNIMQTFDPKTHNLILVAPNFQVWQDNMDQPISYTQSQELDSSMLKIIQSYCQKLDLTYTLLNSQSLKANQIESFNETMLLQNWLTEATQHDGLPLVPLYHDAVQQIIKKYHTPYAIWINGIQTSRVRSAKALVLIAGIVFFPMLPYSLYYVLTPAQILFSYTVIADLSYLQSIETSSHWINIKSGLDVKHAYVYDLIRQLALFTQVEHE